MCLSLDGVVGAHRDPPDLGPRPRAQLAYLHRRPGSQRLGDGVGCGQDCVVVAPARRQRQRRRRQPVNAEKAVGEAHQGAGAGPAPPVDRLVRVTDGGHAVAIAEQRVQHDQLGVAGVLVLVEQHRLGPAAFGRYELGHGARQAGRERDLVAEVKAVPLALELLVGRDDRQHLALGPQLTDQFTHRCPQPAGLAAAIGQRHQLIDPQGKPLVDLVDLDQVLGALTGQVEHRRGHGRDGGVD